MLRSTIVSHKSNKLTTIMLTRGVFLRQLITPFPKDLSKIEMEYGKKYPKHHNQLHMTSDFPYGH